MSTTQLTLMKRMLVAVVLSIFLTAPASAQRFRMKPDTVMCHVDPAEKRQAIQGWGVSLCWWANMCGHWDEDKIDEIIDWLVSPEGLNYNVFRYNIGGGDDPMWRNCQQHHMAKGKGVRAEMEGFQDSLNGDFIWTRDAAQRKIMLKIKEKRPDAIFEAFSNSPPYWMTYSGCVGGNRKATEDNLRPEYYEAFARYLVEVCKHYRDEYGIEFHSLDPFNEPVTDYWYASGSQEGCYFSTESQIKFLKVLKPMLDASGLRTVISASDETSVKQSVEDILTYKKDGEALDIVGQWNTHTYSATDGARDTMRALAAEYAKPLWMSEVGMGGRGIHGNLNLAQKMFSDLKRLQPVVWCDWQYMEDNDQWCLIKGSFRKQTYERIKNYYIRQHVTRFIPVGYQLIANDSEKVLTAISPDGKNMVAVLLNNSFVPGYFSLKAEGFKRPATAFITNMDNNLSSITLPDTELIELPPLSIMTIVY